MFDRQIGRQVESAPNHDPIDIQRERVIAHGIYLLRTALQMEGLLEDAVSSPEVTQTNPFTYEDLIAQLEEGTDAIAA